jgi:hypothetical protein
MVRRAESGSAPPGRGFPRADRRGHSNSGLARGCAGARTGAAPRRL